MDIPLFFGSWRFWEEYIVLGSIILFFFLLSFVRRRRWNKDKVFRLYNARWTALLSVHSLLYAVSVAIASGVILSSVHVVPVYESVSLFLWFDMSKSVLARDIRMEFGEGDKRETKVVSRFALIKSEIENLLPHTVNNKVFLGVFGDEAYPLVPLQEMTEKSIIGFKSELGNITEKTVSRARQGTNIGRVLSATAGYLPAVFREGDRGTCVPAIIVILTDGEPVGSQEELLRDLDEGLRRLERTPCIAIKIVGIGNPDVPSLIPVLDDAGKPTGEYESGEQGLESTRPNFKFLREIASQLKGEFLDGRSGAELASSLKSVLVKDRRITGYRPETEQVSLVWYLGWATLFLLLLANPFRNPVH